MSLLDLANELLLSIAGDLSLESDINALAQTNRRLYFLLNIVSYRFSVRRGNNSALRWAAFHGFFDLVRMLLDIGANVRATPRNSTHLTALHLASAEGHLPIVEALIESGADVNAQTSTGFTPLHKAVSNGFEDITRVLLENGADFMKTLPNQNRSNVVHIASRFGYTAIVQLLFEKGMGIEVKDRELQTPLHYAIEVDVEERLWYGNIRTVEFLLQHNANKDAWNRLGRRPKDLARGHPSPIVELVFQSGSDIRVKEAIQLEQQLRMRKEREQAKKRKSRELADKRAARRLARLTREAGKLEKEQLHREAEEAEEQPDRVERERLAKISRQENQDASRQGWTKMRVEADKEQLRREAEDARNCRERQVKEEIRCILTNEEQDASRQAWSQIRAEAEERNQRLGRTTRPSPCFHPALGWLKCKGRAQCYICGSVCAKYSFRCGDCGVGVCSLCRRTRRVL